MYFNAATDEPLYQRSVSILNKNKIKPKLSTLMVLFLVGFYFSTSIVIEPYYTDTITTPGVFKINEENGFLIKLHNNHYDLYLDNLFVQSIPASELSTFESLPIYNSISEVP